jgi:NAD(P)-dependent dehydrogenase (short-subunit alcohol dehydrogenase family)
VPVALVTGCSSGIGFDTARELARRGHTVYAGVRGNLGEVQREISAGGPSGITVIQLDVTSEGDARQAVTRVAETHGTIDFLVNNAGVSMFAAIEQVSLDQDRRMFETNYFGPLRLIRLVLPLMRAHGGGRIVNVSSGAGWVPVPYLSTYSATKHALDAMTFCLAAETHDQGIKYTIISPGGYNSGVGGKLWQPEHASIEGTNYAATREAHLARWWKHVQGRDPREVALSIANCLESDDPPIRAFVGDDVQGAAQMRYTSDDQTVLRFLIAMV